MLAHVQHLTTLLAAQLAAPWQVVNGTDPQDRRSTPRADVRMQGASVSKTSGPGVVLTATYVVQLVVAGGSAGFAQLDAALDAAVATLHNAHVPGAPARLALQDIRYDDDLDQGLLGYRLAFTLTTTRQGASA